VTLRQGWAKATIGDIADTKLGKMLDATKNKGAPIRYLRNINVRWRAFDLSDLQEMRVTAEEYRDLTVRDGDLFVCEGGEPGRAAVWRGGNQHLVFQKALHRLRSLGDSSSDYLGYYLGYAAANNTLTEFLTGTTIRHLPQVALQRIPVPLPPATEQRRIVAKLDALTARLARARAELDRVEVLSKHLKQQAILHCYNAVGSARATLGSLVNTIESGKNLRCEERPPQAGERGVVKVSAVTWGRFDPKQSKTLPSDYVPPEKSRIRKGDLLISRANTLELVGAVALVEETTDDLFLSDKILRLIVDEADKKWILWFLRSAAGRRQIEGLATGNQLSMRNISQDALRRIMLPYPERTIRQSHIERLEIALAHATQMEAEAARACALLDRLERAILAKAFCGELVSQDPADEPASVLLDRIRAQREAAPTPKRGRRAAAA
jgi:type I restriction enzyme S subunit